MFISNRLVPFPSHIISPSSSSSRGRSYLEEDGTGTKTSKNRGANKSSRKPAKKLNLGGDTKLDEKENRYLIETNAKKVKEFIKKETEEASKYDNSPITIAKRTIKGLPEAAKEVGRYLLRRK